MTNFSRPALCALAVIIASGCGAMKTQTTDQRTTPLSLTDGNAADAKGTDTGTDTGAHSCLSDFDTSNDTINVRRCEEYTTAPDAAVASAKSSCMQDTIPGYGDEVWADAPCSSTNLLGICHIGTTENGFFPDYFFYYRDADGEDTRDGAMADCNGVDGVWNDK